MASYLLFSRTAAFNGNRGAWDVAALAGFGGAIGGASAFDGGPEAFADGTASLFDLSGGPSTATGTAMAAGRAISTSGGASFTAGPSLASFSVTADKVTLALAEGDWNSIKNLELVLRTDDLVERVTIENFVDVRLKLGDGVKIPSGRTYEVDVLNVKRGEIDASELDGGMRLALTTSSNEAGWVNTVTITGSDFDDALSYGAGDSFVGAGGLVVTGGANATIVTDMGGDQGRIALSLSYGYATGPSTAAILAQWESDGAALAANGRITSHRDAAFRLHADSIGLGVRSVGDRSFEIDGKDALYVSIGGDFAGQRAHKVTIDLSLFYERELFGLLGANGFEAAVITLFDFDTVVFSGTFASTSGDWFQNGASPGLSRIVIDSLGAFAFDTVRISAVDDPARRDPHDFLVRGVTFEGLFAAGGDVVTLGPGRDLVTFDATDAANTLDTLYGFESGIDVITIITADATGAGVTVAEIAGDTVFTFADDPAKALIVRGVTGLVAGDDYLFA
jgi:hypothetical protein